MNDEDTHGSWQSAEEITDRILGSDTDVATLHRDIEAYRSAFYEDEGRATAWPAFQALAGVAGWMWSEKPDADPNSTWVRVPWWALQAFAIGHMTYLEGRSNGNHVPFENAFGLAGSKVGKWGAVSRWQRRTQQFEMALEVANVLQRHGLHRAINVLRAIEIVAAHRGVSTSTVWTAWRSNGTKARQTLQKSSSRSEVHRP